MKMPPQHQARKPLPPLAFTLIELLLVVAIIAVLLSLVVPAVGPMMRGSQLTVSAEEIAGFLNQAHQTALTGDKTIEVRFYRYADKNAVGQPTAGYFQAMQVFQYDNQGNATPVTKAQLLPPPVIMDAGTGSTDTLSSILDSASLAKATTAGQAPSSIIPPFTSNGAIPADPQVPVPRAPSMGNVSGTNYTCQAFRFYRDGSTNLIGARCSVTPANWFITLHNSNDISGAGTNGDQIPGTSLTGTSKPHNYATIQVDAFNGSVHVFRP